MGSEDLFKKKRAAKSAKTLKRTKGNKEPLSKILIVCEGLKTEPIYFNEIIEYFNLLTASVIDITGDCGSSPMSVVRYAKKLQKEKIEIGAPYDEIYIVIDKDAHSDYLTALDNISRSNKPSSTWIAINSVPCFEFWLLLHYTYTTRAYKNLPNNSSGNQIIKELRKYIKDYQKGAKGIFHKTLSDLKSKDLQEVIGKAERCCKEVEDTGSDNPSTKVHILISRLLKLNQQIKDNKK
ncbi:RloB family protein [Proteus faecis]|uniref:RloB family protein n=1 Tax=Proteus faecis TaxID=2050967 RepID=A0AAW7CU11_9GAMM|nr:MULTISPECIES: RloB family protein [Proteus]MDL5167989.1 RloB family protein [Proteus faecis]MDL5275974.1 RloB family protein [Proteus faecis]MDL5279541.1 RloB family protein [Proteus faecis]MDL5308647.1 RloB family protein [Proteus faecis]MDL5312209.1 RloB family protein [Proteus faecis]